MQTWVSTGSQSGTEHDNFQGHEKDQSSWNGNKEGQWHCMRGREGGRACGPGKGICLSGKSICQDFHQRDDVSGRTFLKGIWGFRVRTD